MQLPTAPKLRSAMQSRKQQSPRMSVRTITMYFLLGLTLVYAVIVYALTQYAHGTGAADNSLPQSQTAFRHTEEVGLHRIANAVVDKTPSKVVNGIIGKADTAVPPGYAQTNANKNGQSIPEPNHEESFLDKPGPNVLPNHFVKEKNEKKDYHRRDPSRDREKMSPPSKDPPPLVLTAYMEQVRMDEWTVKPLPNRTQSTARADLLKSRTYPQVNSCQRLPQQWPVNCREGSLSDDTPVNAPVINDPFLPWIHDVFPSADGTVIQFVAQNHRRCHTGTTNSEKDILKSQQPQVALFQHVAVKRVKYANRNDDDEVRYRLASHDDADDDGLETRFICHFKDAQGRTLAETLSFFGTSYEYASYRKGHKLMFTEEGRNNKQIHTSQLIFQCPVPSNVEVTRPSDGSTISLRDLIRTGESVNAETDMALYYLDLIPIRTPPRYGPPNMFLPPYYSEFEIDKINPKTGKIDPDHFDATAEWGDRHILPRRVDSGRWENIPICKPSAMTYGSSESIASAHEYADRQPLTPASATPDGQPTPIIDFKTTRHNNVLIQKAVPDHHQSSAEPQKQHRLVSCLWASTGYSTRGERFAINDGQRRLLEFIAYYSMIGVDHFYVYDNSGAFQDGLDVNDDPSPSLMDVIELFPTSKVTWINWPSKVCNNNPNNVDSVGERSSQYAAEASCRLRFGPHTEWIGQFDIDEYLVPMGKFSDINPTFLDKLDHEGTTIASFASWRAWPRRKFVIDPNSRRLSGREYCGSGDWDCFELEIQPETTILQAYNCDRQKPGQKNKRMPAEKQLYRADYVKQHYIHYSTITALSELNRQDVAEYGPSGHKEWKRKNAFPDPLSRFGDEVHEGLMIHAKAVATQDTGGWETVCKAEYDGRAFCRLGNPYPPDSEIEEGFDPKAGDKEGLAYNCYVNDKIDYYYIPRLDTSLRKFVPEIDKKLNWYTEW